jgi:hypothetical protein
MMKLTGLASKIGPMVIPTLLRNLKRGGNAETIDCRDVGLRENDEALTARTTSLLGRRAKGFANTFCYGTILFPTGSGIDGRTSCRYYRGLSGRRARQSRGRGRSAVSDAYDGLRALIVRKLGKRGAVQSVEDEPRSETAQAALAEALTKAGLSADTELAQQAEALRETISGAAEAGDAGIEVGDITGRVNVLVNNLVASGRIKLGNIRAETGDATLTNVTAGVAASKKG